MPTYEYKCLACKHEIEIVHKMSESPEITCPECSNSVMVKKIGMGFSVQFKGTGFYETDYKNKS